MTDRHIEKQLTQMMLERAAREAAEGNIDAAVALLKSVVIAYPDHPSRNSERHRTIEALLKNEPRPPDQYEVVAAAFDLAELRLPTIPYSEIADTTSHDIGTPIAVAVLKTFMPRFAFAAEAIVQRHTTGTLFDTAHVGDALTFGGAAPSKSVVSLIRSCLKIADQLTAHLALSLLVRLAGNSAANHEQDILIRIKATEATNRRFANAIRDLRKASSVHNDDKDTDVYRSLLHALLHMRPNSGEFEPT